MLINAFHAALEEEKAFSMDEASVGAREELARIRRILSHLKAWKDREFTLGLIESDMSADEARVELTGLSVKPK
jgi:hypothetical protein